MKDESNIKTMGLIALLGIGALFLLSKSKKQQPSNDVAMTLLQVSNQFGFDAVPGVERVKEHIQEGKYKAFEKDGQLFVWQSELERYFGHPLPFGII